MEVGRGGSRQALSSGAQIPARGDRGDREKKAGAVQQGRAEGCPECGGGCGVGGPGATLPATRLFENPPAPSAGRGRNFRFN